jgi:hypothetical protein
MQTTEQYTSLVTSDEGPSRETSKFLLYFSGSCIPTNESLLLHDWQWLDELYAHADLTTVYSFTTHLKSSGYWLIASFTRSPVTWTICILSRWTYSIKKTQNIMTILSEIFTNILETALWVTNIPPCMYHYATTGIFGIVRSG